MMALMANLLWGALHIQGSTSGRGLGGSVGFSMSAIGILGFGLWILLVALGFFVIEFMVANLVLTGYVLVILIMLTQVLAGGVRRILSIQI
jgi:hypothetical protein